MATVLVRRTVWKDPTTEGESPVFENFVRVEKHLSRSGHVEPRLNLRGPSRKAKYSLMTDSELSSASER